MIELPEEPLKDSINLTRPFFLGILTLYGTSERWTNLLIAHKTPLPFDCAHSQPLTPPISCGSQIEKCFVLHCHLTVARLSTQPCVAFTTLSFYIFFNKTYPVYILL